MAYVAKASQTVAFTLASTNAFAKAGIIALKGISSLGVPVSCTSANMSILLILRTNAVMVGTGTNTVTASQIGDANFNAAAPVTRTIVVKERARP